MFFKEALPVWPAGMKNEMNITCAVSCKIRQDELYDKSDAVLHITAVNLYRMFLNGELVSYGPARAA